MDVLLGAQNSLTVKGGYFHDRYSDTDNPGVPSYTYQTSAVGLPFAIPARPHWRRQHLQYAATAGQG